MGGTSQTFEYFLPRTVVRFSGRRSETTDEFASPPEVEFEASVECAERADPEWSLRIELEQTFLRDVEGSIGFTADRRLSSVSAASKGTAGKLVSGAARFLTTTIAAIARISVAGAGAGAETRTVTNVDPEVEYAKECEAAAKNRQDLRAAVVSVRSAIVETAGAAGDDSAQRLRALTHTMTVLADLQDEAEAHFTAWRAGKKKSSVQDLEFEVPILQLPEAADIEGRLGNLDETLLGPCWEPFQQLGVFTAVESVGHDAPAAEDAVVETRPGFYFRTPRFVWLSTYQRTGKVKTARLVERRRQLVYDAKCGMEYVSCHSGTWSQRTVNAELDGGSGLSRISTAGQGGGQAAGTALTDAVAQAVQGLADAETITKSIDAVQDRRLDRQLTLVEKRTKLLEAEVAVDAAAADRTKLRELARLKHEKELLTAREDVAELRDPPGDTVSANGKGATNAKRIVVSLEP